MLEGCDSHQENNGVNVKKKAMVMPLLELGRTFHAWGKRGGSGNVQAKMYGNMRPQDQSVSYNGI